ncbi:ATP-binding protein [Bacteroidia bacterium]|nr:ATP-binding protein [Bacteroidia bacterium]
MILNNMHLSNFRCFEDLDITFHSSFNILLGINGTGKTAILEALRIAIGSLFSELDKIENKIYSPNITDDDVRLHNGEMQYEVRINTSIKVKDYLNPNSFQELTWSRFVERYGGNTRYDNPKDIKAVSKEIQSIIRNGEKKTIPLIAYYSTDRYKKEKKNTGLEADGSRLRGYYNTLDSSTNIGFFLNIYKTETLWELQHGETSILLSAVNNAVKVCVEDCKRIYHDVKKDELTIQLTNDELIPYRMLSDGIRSVLAMVMELAFRCYLLNPHLKEKAAAETNGLVLIDEIDLHLHPEWQKKIVNDLRTAFPSLQFIVTTHAPLVIGSLKDGEIFCISDQQVYNFPIQYGKDSNSILLEMGTSEMDDKLKEKRDSYFILIENGNGKTEIALSLREELERILGKDHSELQRADMMLSFF